MNANYSTAIYNNNWKFSDGSSSYNSNTAYGNGKFTHKILFITTKISQSTFTCLVINMEIYHDKPIKGNNFQVYRIF